MHVAFDEMPYTARLWIYQADRQFSKDEKINIQAETASFLEEWTAHGADLSSSHTILYDQFLIIAVDQNLVMASGCSIDKQVQFVQALGQKLGINFMDRTKVAFLSDSNGSGQKEILTAPLNELKERVTNGAVKADTLTFNNLIETKAQLGAQWIVPASASWMKRYF